MNKILVSIGLAMILVGGAWYFRGVFNQFGSQDEVKVVSQREPIVAGSFTREESLAQLAFFVQDSTFDFTGVDDVERVTVDSLPPEIMKFAVSVSGEEVTIGKAANGSKLYSITYFEKYAMPENHSRFLRMRDLEEFKLVQAKRGRLASVIEIESALHQVRISQLAVSESRTEVIIFVKAK